MKPHTFRRPRFRAFSMRTQLTLILLVAILTTIAALTFTSYRRQQRSFIEEYTSSTKTILAMEQDGLDQYIKDLRAYASAPCLNVPVYNSMLQKSLFSADETSAIRTEIQNEFHSRTDILSYALTVLFQGVRFERPLHGQHVQAVADTQTASTKPYQMCEASPMNEYIAPAEGDKVFFTYHHFLIRLQDRKPISLTSINVDKTQLKLLLSHHKTYKQNLLLMNSQGEVLYSGSADLEKEASRIYASFAEDTTSRYKLGGEDSLCIRDTREDTGLTMISLLPRQELNAQAGQFIRPVVMEIAVVLLLLLLVLWLIIRRITVPLISLSHKMSRTGQGDFSTFAVNSGCKETEILRRSYNDMISELDELIQKNYVANINEKNARLKALEAQLNPHFLYNTLQAIATQALLADQPEIYDMIVSLAGNLRYTVKGDELVPLRDEITYVKSYILLQQTRLGRRLETNLQIAQDCHDILIPKISIQMLVENAILHGLRDDGSTLHISIDVDATTIGHRGDVLRITVKDDGRGITEDEMSVLHYVMTQADILSPDNHRVGLANLANRLRILYQGQAKLDLQSSEGQFTTVTMELPISDGVKENTPTVES